jgi:hypothetical protein
VVLAQATLNSVRLKLGVMGKASRFQELPSSEACLFEEVPLTHEVHAALDSSL